jgi:hypothetical protein
MEGKPASMVELMREKQASRDADDRALASGKKSREELRRENGLFVFPRAKINYERSRLS